MIVNDTVGAGIRSKEGRGTAGALNQVSVAGPGVKHGIQRALKVRNLGAETALTKAQSAYLDHRRAYDPKARLRDMGILIQSAGVMPPHWWPARRSSTIAMSSQV